MLHERITALHTLHFILQTVIAQIAFWASFFCSMLGSDNSLTQAIATHSAFAFVMAMAMLAFRKTWGFGRLDILRIGWLQNHSDTARQTLWILGSFFVLRGTLHTSDISLAFLLSSTAAIYPAILLGNKLLIRPIISFTNPAGDELTLLVGKKPSDPNFARWLADLHLFGQVQINGESLEHSMDTDDAFSVEKLERVVTSRPIRRLILLEVPRNSIHLRGLVHYCNKHAIRLAMVNRLPEQLGCPLMMRSESGVDLLMLRAEPLENPLNRFMKRFLDIVVSALGLVITMPILIPLVWLLHRWQCPGPVFYSQERQGWRNGSFRIFKFRSMYLNYDEARQATVGDVRIFPAGKFLRRFSLDEFPQLWNVLRGDMSLVGPRPHLAKHNETFKLVMENYNVRGLVRPGLTGLAQVRGFRGEVTAPDQLVKRVASDIYYVENWSLTLDFLILLRTAVLVVFPPHTAR